MKQYHVASLGRATCRDGSGRDYMLVARHAGGAHAGRMVPRRDEAWERIRRVPVGREGRLKVEVPSGMEDGFEDAHQGYTWRRHGEMETHASRAEGGVGPACMHA